MPQATAQRRVQRIRHELRMRDVEVVRREQISPHFVSLTFAGESLADFVSAGFDDHIKFMFEDTDGSIVRRDYTPRRFDAQARELTVEFALHGDGKVCRWAERAQPGSQAVIGGPRGSMIVPTDFAWHLFVADATGLPAVHRRLEELPADARAIALLQVEAADRRVFASAASLDLHWFDSAPELLAAVAALQLPAGEGFAWGAGEAASMLRVRQLLVQDKAQPKEAMRIAAYWRQGQSDYHEELDQ